MGVCGRILGCDTGDGRGDIMTEKCGKAVGVVGRVFRFGGLESES